RVQQEWETELLFLRALPRCRDVPVSNDERARPSGGRASRIDRPPRRDDREGHDRSGDDPGRGHPALATTPHHRTLGPFEEPTSRIRAMWVPRRVPNLSTRVYAIDLLICTLIPSGSRNSTTLSAGRSSALTPSALSLRAASRRSKSTTPTQK